MFDQGTQTWTVAYTVATSQRCYANDTNATKQRAQVEASLADEYLTPWVATPNRHCFGNWGTSTTVTQRRNGSFFMSSFCVCRAYKRFVRCVRCVRSVRFVRSLPTLTCNCTDGFGCLVYKVRSGAGAPPCLSRSAAQSVAPTPRAWPFQAPSRAARPPA